MSRPVVGITTYLESATWGVWSRRAALLPESYLHAVAKAGGVPVLLPPQDPAAAVAALNAVDALVVAGGADIDPATYGAPGHTRTVETRPDRDSWESALFEGALAQNLPVIGVCRGMQLMNVALGGTLEQHIPDTGALPAHQPAVGVFGRHRIRIRGGSRLAEILGAELEVASYHHQGIAELAPGLESAAWTDDEVIEAVEMSGPQFALGVQWHPEEHDEIPLFHALVQAASGGRS